MSEREFKSATEAVEFYREQVRTQNGYAMQQRLRAEEAEAERDRLLKDYAEAQAGWDKVSDECDRLRAALERLNVRWFVSNQMRRRIASEALKETT